jgi:hypothetical protein
LTRADLVQVCARLRVADANTPVTATKLARRIGVLEDELVRLDAQLGPLVAPARPQLLELRGVGPDTASILLVTAGDNSERLHSEGSFAKLCGVASLEASSGRVRRHRLNRGGDRQANHALWRIVLVRVHCDPRTRAYVARRRAEGLSTREIMRCLKRYVAREIYRVLTAYSAARVCNTLRLWRSCSISICSTTPIRLKSMTKRPICSSTCRSASTTSTRYGNPIRFYPAIPPAHWLMVAEVAGRVLVVPLAPPDSGDPLKCRPIGCYEAAVHLADQYRRNR